jgi:RNA polymerase sigma factor (sigma-70 family)
MQMTGAGLLVLATEPDEVLAERAAGDFEAFEELYRRYMIHVYRFVRAQAQDDPTAEDLTAQVFFRALSSASTFKATGSYKSWLFRIAHNVLASWREGKGRSVTVEEVPDKEDPTPSPVSQAIAREERGVVWKKVAELPLAQREVVTLRYAEDLSVEEIARVTKKSRGAIRILLHRARHRLRNALEGKEIR